MPKIDIPIKRLFQRRPADWVKYVLPDCREDWIRPYQTEYTPKKESRLDNVFEITDPKGTYLVNFEPMGYYDVALPARMLRYRSDIWEATMIEGKGIPSIRQVVIFFYRENDNKVHRLNDYWGKATMLNYTYRVLRIWDEPRQQVIENELIGLYPLLPLMKGNREKEEPKQVLQESISVIQNVNDKSLQQDLLAAMAILAGGKYAPELIHMMIRREMVMQSPIYQEWVKEERAEAEARGIGRGKIEKAQDAICKILNRRFGLDSLKLQHQVKSIDSEPILDWIFDEIMDINTKEDAKNIIETAIKQFKQ